jgi:hypothetical protein
MNKMLFKALNREDNFIATRTNQIIEI